ncbi:hypothetical protein ACCAA_440029 [Candidatus Accumulibacter aalborgensis]|uniref:Uncharacterized protein n=1 Tax=Candidatus Accumulibacter aalborgensis TaxID=1860102 RepID=A0A1A8XUB1_9PROT|nr:hypothetical protein ACCAA_440029 [Candidatus Accumulibacter aalborgensis]
MPQQCGADFGYGSLRAGGRSRQLAGASGNDFPTFFRFADERPTGGLPMIQSKPRANARRFV